MQNDNDELEILRRELRLTRIFCMVSSAVTLCLLAGIIILSSRVKPVYEFMKEAGPVLEQASKLDVDAFNETLNRMNESLGQVDWAQLSDTLNSLDVDAINNALENLDMEEFSKTLANLNNVADALKDLSSKFSSLPSVFGITK